MRIDLLVAVALVFAGCLGGLGGDDGDGPRGPAGEAQRVGDLVAPGAQTSRVGGDLVLAWTGQLGAGAFVPLVGTAPNSDAVDLSLPVDATVRTATVELQGSASAAAALRDADGHLLCGLRAGRVCATRINASAPASWPMRVMSLSPEGVDFTLTVRLGADAPVLVDNTYPLTPGQVFVTEEEGGEPTLALLDDGRMVVASGSGALRFNPDGTYEDVSPPVDGTLQQTLDPFLVKDRLGNRVYISQLAQCMRLSWTDDGGDTWTTNPVACGGPEQHHQKIAIGPAPIGRAVHIGTMNLASWLLTEDVVIFHSVSLDQGLTFTEKPVMLKDVEGMEARAVGNIETSETDGSVTIVAYLCDKFVDAQFEGVAVGRSTDYGLTWDWQQIAPGGGRCEGIDPGITWTRDGWYVAWEDITAGTGHVWLSSSPDGVAWTPPEALPTPGLRSFAFTDTAASAGTLAVLFLATPDTDLGPTQAPGWARWYPYLALYRFERPELGWNVTRLQEHPVQIGPICMDGPMCMDGARNLLDFIDVQVSGSGDVAMAYADGCDEDCAMPWQSRGSDLRVAWLSDLPPGGRDGLRQ